MALFGSFMSKMLIGDTPLTQLIFLFIFRDRRACNRPISKSSKNYKAQTKIHGQKFYVSLRVQQSRQTDVKQ